MEKAAGRGTRGARLVARLLGDALLGMSLGLLVYYALTGVLGRVEEGRLREGLAPLGPIAAEAAESVPVKSGGPAIDLAGWEGEDAAYWESLPEGGVFGRLVARKMGLDAVVVKGVRSADLRKGPGWIPKTSMPGAEGNAGISGHRTTYGQPFRRLHELAEGDDVYLYSPYRRYRYRVERVFSVTPDRVDVLAAGEYPMLTMTACNPPYSARERLIVQSRLVRVERIEGAPPAGR